MIEVTSRLRPKTHYKISEGKDASKKKEGKDENEILGGIGQRNI